MILTPPSSVTVTLEEAAVGVAGSVGANLAGDGTIGTDGGREGCIGGGVAGDLFIAGAGTGAGADRKVGAAGTGAGRGEDGAGVAGRGAAIGGSGGALTVGAGGNFGEAT